MSLSFLSEPKVRSLIRDWCIQWALMSDNDTEETVERTISRLKADAWDDCLELLESNSEIGLDDVEHYKEICPYRKQEEANELSY